MVTLRSAILEEFRDVIVEARKVPETQRLAACLPLGPNLQDGFEYRVKDCSFELASVPSDHWQRSHREGPHSCL